MVQQVQLFVGQQVLSSRMIEGFRSIHNNGVDRLVYGEKATVEVDICGTNTHSAHGLYYDGIYAIAAVAHSGCLSNRRFIVKEGLDLALMAECPSFAINATTLIDLRMGDEVVVFGFGRRFNYYQGYVSSLSGSKGYNLFPHLQQFPGMSGGVAINGCGYGGMSIAYTIHRVYEMNITEANAIPAAIIKKFMRANRKLLPTYESCQNITTILPSLS